METEMAEESGDRAKPGTIKKSSPRSGAKSVSRSREKREGAQKHHQTHARKKRPPKRLTQPPRVNDIYVNRRSDFVSQLARCRKLLDQGVNELFIHGLGAAINRSINLALQLKETPGENLEIRVTTSTVELTDDMEPLTETGDHFTQTRNVSALHITLYRPHVVSTHNGSIPSS